MIAATEYRTDDALELYTKSFEANPNPAPLINRAKLYRWRLLFDKAIADLELAMRLDKQQGDEFSMDLVRELRECKAISQNRINGKKLGFQADLTDKGFDYVSSRIADVVFKGNGQQMAYHLVYEMDNVQKFERRSDFPSADSLLKNWMKSQDTMDGILSDPALSQEYIDTRMLFEAMVCVYEYSDMAKMRDTIIQKIWCKLNPPSQRQAIWEAVLRETFA